MCGSNIIKINCHLNVINCTYWKAGENLTSNMQSQTVEFIYPLIKTFLTTWSIVKDLKKQFIMHQSEEQIRNKVIDVYFYNKGLLGHFLRFGTSANHS